MVLVKLKSKLLLDKYILFIFVCLTTVVIYRYFNTDCYPEYWKEYTQYSQEFESILTSNIDIFNKSPLQSLSKNSQDYPISNTGIITTSASEFDQIYRFLSFHPFWMFNSLLTRLMVIGQFNLIIVGVIIATNVYREKETPTNNNFKKQLFTSLCFALSLLFIISTLGMIISYLKYNLQIKNTEEMRTILNLYEQNKLWKPNTLYYVRAVLGVLVSLLSYIAFGIFIGHLLKDSIISLIFIFFVANYFFSYLIAYPISPTYFLMKISDYFIYNTASYTTISGNIIINIVTFILYIIIVLGLSKKLMSLHLKNKK